MTTNWNTHSSFWGDFFEGEILCFGWLRKKKMVMWFYAQSSCVTIWGKRESHHISNSVFKGGAEWKMEEDLGSSHLPIPRGLHILSSHHQHIWEWLAGKAPPDWPPSQGEWDIGSVGVMKELSAVNQLMETLPTHLWEASWIEKRCLKSKIANNPLSLSNACSGTLGQAEWEIFR